MSDFKVGDKVVINSLHRSHMGQVHDGEIVTIKEIKSNNHVNGGEEYAMFEEFHQDGVWLNELEHIEQPEVIVREQITVKEPGLQLQYMTNTKKDRVSIIINGNSAGRIPFERIDQLIALLVTLQEEV